MQRRYNLAYSILTEVFILSLVGFVAGVDARSQIAYDSERRGNEEIFVMDSDGQNPRNLTNHPANDWHPSWSPSGARLAFTSNRDATFGIYVMDANGENVHNLTRHPLGDDLPAWSPLGDKIAFRSNRDGAR